MPKSTTTTGARNDVTPPQHWPAGPGQSCPGSDNRFPHRVVFDVSSRQFSLYSRTASARGVARGTTLRYAVARLADEADQARFRFAGQPRSVGMSIAVITRRAFARPMCVFVLPISVEAWSNGVMEWRSNGNQFQHPITASLSTVHFSSVTSPPMMRSRWPCSVRNSNAPSSPSDSARPRIFRSPI